MEGKKGIKQDEPRALNTRGFAARLAERVWSGRFMQADQAR